MKIPEGFLAALAAGVVLAGTPHWISAETDPKEKAVVQVASGSDLEKRQREFLKSLSHQLGVEYRKVDPASERSMEKSLRPCGIAEMSEGVFFVGEKIHRSTLENMDMEKAALEYTLDNLEGTNAVLVFGADWCILCKIADKYMERLLKDFPEYRRVYFKSGSRTAEEFEPLEKVLEKRYGLEQAGLPLVFYFGKNVIAGGGINTRHAQVLAATGTYGFTIIFHNQRLVNFQSDADTNNYKVVPVGVILEQNRN